MLFKRSGLVAMCKVFSREGMLLKVFLGVRRVLMAAAKQHQLLVDLGVQ